MFSHAPTGLYGWIKSNDGRSLGLFLGFLMAVQVLAIPTLFFPLTLLDVAHAPFLAWGGYVTRYAPLVAVASVVWFGWKYWWHIETVKRAVGFHFIDSAEEPYLCSVIEPLITMWGLPVPFVGVIESDARNAFACGIARKKAVVVVTRGLIDSLTREELECVLAHELSHIKNGDIRLMAAANIFMTALTELQRSNPMQMTPVHALMAIAVPAVLPLTLLGHFLGWVSLRAGQMSRLMIASKREFIADAEAVQITKNPGAMASALVKVEHAHVVRGMRREDDAMMIAGDTEGENATHPTVAQRIAALARTTGSMVFNSPHSPTAEQFASNPSLSGAEASALLRRLPAHDVAKRTREKDSGGWFSMGPTALASTIFAVVALTGLHWEELNQPRMVLAKFDARPISVMVGTPMGCSMGMMPRSDCQPQAGSSAYAAFEGQKNTLVGLLADRSKARREAGHDAPDITLSNLETLNTHRDEYRGISGRLTGTMVTYAGDKWTFRENGRVVYGVPTRLHIAEVEQVGCYPGMSLNYGDWDGRYSLGSGGNDGRGIAKHLEWIEQEARYPGLPGSLSETKRLKAYAEMRAVLIHQAFDFWGKAGYDMARQAYQTQAHDEIVARLGEVWDQDPAFRAGFNEFETAKVKSLIARPRDFLPCNVLREIDQRT